jgi:diguanylate cyclase (GGDEF)-like protein
MLSDGSHWRRLALFCVLGASSTAVASETSPPLHGQTLPAHPPIFKNADGVTCRYRLDGLQKEFTETTLSEVRFTSLPAGQYSFQVICDAPQLQESKAAAYAFTVPGSAAGASAWWQTSWMEMGTFGVALLVWAMLWSRYRDRRENERLERAVAERSAELARANHELQEASLCDPLTGLRNRRFFQTMIPADASQAVRAYRGSEVYGRDHRDLMFFLVDIDHFKDVNDEYGHDAGDRVLVQIAQRLSRVMRESDFLIRWGGEEFLVVFRAAERNDGALLASRILKAVNSAEFDLGNERHLARSCSVGWAAFPWLPPACSDLSVEEVLRLADRGLYLAKQGGRNQAVGMIAATNAPVINSAAGGAAVANVVARPAKYCNLEQLLEDELIREVRTLGGISAAAAG